MRASTAKALEHIEHIVRVVYDKLGRKGFKPGLHSSGEIIIKPNNTQVIIKDKRGRCVGVYEDPPGICRPCIRYVVTIGKAVLE